MSAQTSFWPFLAIYLVGLATGGLAVGAFAALRISDLKRENALLRAGLAGAIRMTASLPQRVRKVAGAVSCTLLMLFAAATEGYAQQATPASASQTADARDDNALAYCRNIANTASDARFARQAAALAAMEKEIEARIAQLEAKRAEYQDWLQRRETFLKKADESLIAVISQMRPDAAAAQISVMADEAAAAVLAKLNPRSASAILNEMEPARAASLTNTMVGISRRAQAEGRS
ncbi:MotE family protein [Azorhizobium doebereinerae]|uniref:MotE family protein n=1 Tax=Azorhizobium doebereinerae TaxID=281091 RepID=UPI000686FA72|nr:MotE family protein [Azorhizobium doebereinerae]